ncbi:hypothetical protein [Photobacterium leiognathi]|uniref:hypothetical protein n=1 Tax=Photobacterium leiognathi TaxID=553611 RepID=UPI002981EA3D|nr:hypothetical protein [Photobacterium leiognathi]
MDIMYAILPNKTIAITDLHGLHYQQYQIMKTKFIADTEEGIVFAALVENIERNVASVDMIQHAVLVKKCTRFCTRSFKDCVSENAKRKHFRKQHNLAMTGKNWKQFVDKKNTILTNFLSLDGQYHC